MKLNTVLDTVKTIITFVLWAIIAPIFTIIGFPCALLPSKHRYSNRFYYLCSYLGAFGLIKATFIKIHIIGKENLKKNLHNPSIVASNHTSALDIPLIQMLIGAKPHVWFTKETYTKIPFFGFLLKRMNIVVCRTSATKCAQTIEQARAVTDGHNNHILIFPEGMRHNNGKIHRFYPGVGVLAQELDRPIIPIVIHGLNKIFPKNSKIINSSATQVTLSIGAPMWYTGAETRQEFIDRVHNWFVCEMEHLSRLD